MLLRQLWPQQVLWDVQARRDKERQKAKRAAAGADTAALAVTVKGMWPVMLPGSLACLFASHGGVVWVGYCSAVIPYDSYAMVQLVTCWCLFSRSPINAPMGRVEPSEHSLHSVSRHAVRPVFVMLNLADDDVEILDSPKKDKQQQHQEQEQLEQQQPLVIAANGDVTMIDADTDAEQQQQPDGAPADRAGSPGAAADAAAAAAPGSWQLPFKLDGSEQLTQQQLLDVLPEFQVVNAYVCEKCSAHLQEATAGHQGLRQQLEGQRLELSKLLAGVVTEALEQGVTYYLVPK
jgi:hypothetical protein